MFKTRPELLVFFMTMLHNFKSLLCFDDLDPIIKVKSQVSNGKFSCYQVHEIY